MKKKTRTRSRAEIQRALDPAVAGTLIEMRMPEDIPHIRRSCRALMSIAADMAQRKGCSFDEFICMARECFAKEAVVDVCGIPMIFIEPGGEA